MAQIRKDDIIQQKEIEDALQSIANYVKQLSDEMGKLKASTGLTNLKDLDKEAKKLTKTKKELAEADKAVNSEMLKMKEAISKQRSKEYNEELRAMAQSAREVAAAEKKKNNEMRKSKEAIDKQRTKAYTDDLKRQEQATRLLIKAQQADAGSKQKLQAQNRLLQHRMKGLNTLIPEQRAEFERLNREINNNNRKISELSQKSGGLRSVFGGLTKTLGSYFLALIAVQRVIAFFTRDLLNMTARLDSLDFSMKTVMKSQEEYAQAQIFLGETAVNYGQDLLVLSERYIKFRAAAQQSNLSIKDTQQIFDSTAKAAAVLGLKTDEVNGVFLALEQMISKGKVTTEELRRQLGERLPGAFGIMADAVGVSISELDKMMKAGEVLSTEALPKFAVALEKAYGIESVQMVDTLAAAQGRLKTTWVEFVDALNASSAYKNTITFLSDLINYTQVAFGYTTRMLDIYLRISDEAGDATRGLVENFDNIDIKKLTDNAEEYRDQWVKAMKEVGIRTKDAAWMFELYVQRREQSILKDMSNARSIVPFDLKEYRKVLENAEEEYSGLSILQEGELKKQAEQNAAFYKDSQKSYRQYLLNQVKELESKTRMAENLYVIEKASQESILAEGGEITKEQKNQLDQRYRNYQNYIQASILLQEKLYGKDGSGSGKDDTVNLLKERHKAELEALKRQQQERLRVQEEHLANQFQSENDYNAALADQEEQNRQEQLDLQITHQNALLEVVEKGTLDEAKILADREKLYADKEKAITDAQVKDREYGIKRMNEILKQEQTDRENAANETLAIAQQSVHEEYLTMLGRAEERIKASKGNANEIRQIENQLTLDIIDEEIKRLQVALESMDERTKAYQQTIERIDQLEEMRGEQSLQATEDTEKLKLDIRRQIQERSADLIMEGFNLTNTLYDAQLQKLQEMYELEVAAAGDSVERRLRAERKYEREKAKIMRRQAIAQKAQAALGVALNTAQAIISIWAQVPKFDFGVSAGALTAMVAGIGALQLASVLAAPIPSFAKGTKDAPETFIAGEQGEELIFKSDGSAVLTPDKPTLFSDKSFIGSTILPHDQTQKWLANYAVTQSYDIIDMSSTNKILNSIARNTKNRESVDYDNKGRKVIKHGYITSTVI